jgi:hypothetical protein
MPDVMNTLKKLELFIYTQDFADQGGRMHFGIRRNEAPDTLLQFKAALWRVSADEALGLGWPPGVALEPVQ